MPPSIAITFTPSSNARAAVDGILGTAANAIYIEHLDDQARAAALTSAVAILAHDTGKELRPHEPALLTNTRLIQFMTAGVDYVPLSLLPAHIPIANNGGAYADAMAEHAVALTLAAAKRLLIEHKALTEGVFNQFTRNRTLRGATCGILGFGGIGKATARLMRGMGMRIHALNRSGVTTEPVDWIGAEDQLASLLASADVLIVSAPLTRKTQNLLGAAQLAMMKPDAILVNLARGELIDEAALYAHLQAHKTFFACIDAWWIEPVRHGEFRMNYPFLTLPNVIGSPHNSASVPGNVEAALRHALENIRLVLNGGQPMNLIGEDEKMR